MMGYRELVAVAALIAMTVGPALAKGGGGGGGAGGVGCWAATRVTSVVAKRAPANKRVADMCAPEKALRLVAHDSWLKA